MSASIGSAKNPGTPKPIPGVVTSPSVTGPHVAIPGCATTDKEQGLTSIPNVGTAPGKG